MPVDEYKKTLPGKEPPAGEDSRGGRRLYFELFREAVARRWPEARALWPRLEPAAGAMTSGGR